MAIMCLLALTACGSDGDGDKGFNGGGSNNSGIVGEWAAQQMTNDESYLFMESLNLKSNGTFTIVDYEVFRSGSTITDMEKDEFSGNYTAKDGVLTLAVNGQTVTYSYAVSGDVLKLMNSQGMVEYDRMTSSIREIFASAESTYQKNFKK